MSTEPRPLSDDELMLAVQIADARLLEAKNQVAAAKRSAKSAMDKRRKDLLARLKKDGGWSRSHVYGASSVENRIIEAILKASIFP